MTSEPFFVMCACGHGQQEEFDDPTHREWKCDGCFRHNSFLEVRVRKSKYPPWTGTITRHRLGEEGRSLIDREYQGNAQERFQWE